MISPLKPAYPSKYLRLAKIISNTALRRSPPVLIFPLKPLFIGDFMGFPIAMFEYTKQAQLRRHEHIPAIYPIANFEFAEKQQLD